MMSVGLQWIYLFYFYAIPLRSPLIRLPLTIFQRPLAVWHEPRPTLCPAIRHHRRPVGWLAGTEKY